MSTRTRWLVGAAVCVVAVIGGATVVRVTEEEEPMLVEVPCDPDQFVDKSEVDTTVCYDAEAIEGATQQQEFTLICNSRHAPCRSGSAIATSRPRSATPTTRRMSAASAT